MKKIKLFGITLACLSLVGGGLAFSKDNKILESFATTGHVDTNLKTYYDSITTSPDKNYYKTMDENTDYPLGDGSVVNMRADRGLTTQVPQVRNHGNNGINYYIYIKYNPTHTEVGQLGASLIFNAEPGYLLDSVNLFNGYQVADAFQIEIYNQLSSKYEVDAYDQMFSGSNATYSYTFSKPTTSFKITHYLHSTSSHNLVGWKETRVSYETGYTLTFNSNGGSSVNSQIYPEVTNINPTQPADPTRPNVGTTKYIFAGWFTDAQCTAGNEFDFDTPLTSNTTVYAKWNEETISGYTMTFVTNGGSSISPIVTEVGDTFTKPDDPIPPAGGKYVYIFDGWYTDVDLTSAYDWSTPSSSDITLYAKYNLSNSPVAEGALKYDLGANAGSPNEGKPYYWDNTEVADGHYHTSFSVDSYYGFDKAQTLPEMRLSYQSLTGGNNTGIQFANTTYRNNPIIRICKMTITALDTEKVIVYARAECDSYGSVAGTMSMYANDSSAKCDQDEAPNNNGYTKRLLQASFSAQDRITSVSFATGEDGLWSQVKIRYVYIVYAENPDFTTAKTYAANFNDAKVCGTSDTDGLNESKWSQQADLFVELDDAVKLYFHNYLGSNTEIIECLERYDRVIYLRGEDYDFMGRIESDNIPTISSQKIGLFVSKITHNNSSIVLIVLSSFSVLAITAFFVTRRKEND